MVILDDFRDLIKGINTNYYGMLDQLIASKGQVFCGTWFSTSSGYVNRMRGYYIARHKLDGYENGTMESYYVSIAHKVMSAVYFVDSSFNPPHVCTHVSIIIYVSQIPNFNRQFNPDDRINQMRKYMPVKKPM